MKIGPKYKIARRLGERVFPKTQTTKFSTAGAGRKKPLKNARGGVTEYGLQLIEKQKARYTYCVTEKQFRQYADEAKGAKSDTPAVHLYRRLETRLDNVVFRLGLVSSRLFARQAVAHGHILVNGRRVTIPSYRVKTGEVISIRSQSRQNGIFTNLAEKQKNLQVPNWIDYQPEKVEGTVRGLPILGEGETNINFGTILEFYSRV